MHDLGLLERSERIEIPESMNSAQLQLSSKAAGKSGCFGRDACALRPLRLLSWLCLPCVAVSLHCLAQGMSTLHGLCFSLAVHHESYPGAACLCQLRAASFQHGEAAGHDSRYRLGKLPGACRH